MKTILKLITERYYLHFIVGGVLGLLLHLTFTDVQLWGRIVLTSVMIGVISFMWEGFWVMVNGSKADKWDIIWSVIGGEIAVILLYLL